MRTADRKLPFRQSRTKVKKVAKGADGRLRGVDGGKDTYGKKFLENIAVVILTYGEKYLGDIFWR
jgi:hypothetical protein